MIAPPPLETVAPSYSYTEMEAAQLLRISRSTLGQLRREGLIRYCKHGLKRGIRYTRNHIEEYHLKAQGL